MDENASNAAVLTAGLMQSAQHRPDKAGKVLTSGTWGSGVKVYARLEMLPSDSAWRTRMILRGRMRISLGVAPLQGRTR